MPRKNAVQSEAVVSSPAPRKRTPAKSAAAASSAAPVEKKTRAPRKKVEAAADTTTVAAVTHRHKKQEVTVHVEDAKVQAPSVPVYEPSHDEVAGLAYSYYVARGYQPGNPTADWFRAIEELKQRHLASLLSDRQ